MSEVEVLDAQPQALHQAQAGAVAALRHQSAGAREVVENAAHFLFGEDGGQAFGLLGVQGVNRASAPFQRLAGEEQNGTAGVMAGGGGDSRFDCQMGEEGFDFGRPHLVRAAFAMEQDKAPDPVHLGVFGADGVVVKAQGVADLVEQVLGSAQDHGAAPGNEGYRGPGRAGSRELVPLVFLRRA